MTVEITLTRNQTALVDDADADLLALKWCAFKTGRGYFYAKRGRTMSPGKQSSEYLHRVVLSRILGRQLATDEQADHINGVGLDNRRLNLRLATAQQNTHNRRTRRDNSSAYKGVRAENNGWRALIRVNEKTKYLGIFDNIIDAAIAHDRAAYEAFGDFARCNYPRFACGLVSA